MITGNKGEWSEVYTFFKLLSEGKLYAADADLKNRKYILSHNRNEFQDYLLKNTRLETPSSTRYQFGKLYEDNDEFFIKLNLQIRFKA